MTIDQIVPRLQSRSKQDRFFFKTAALRSILTLVETETGKKSHNIKNCKSFNNFKAIEITFLKSILNKSA